MSNKKIPEMKSLQQKIKRMIEIEKAGMRIEEVFPPIVNGSPLENRNTMVSLESLYPYGRRQVPHSDFIKQVESVYRGLGIPVLYGTLSILANKSVFFIGGRGIGKTRIIKSVPNIEGTVTSGWDSFTLGELDIFCATHKNMEPSGVHGKHFAFKVEEFSTLSEYHREIFLTICSRISSDGNYTHVTTLTPNLRIEDCKLTMLIAIQPKLYSLLCNRYTQWDSMSYDRFTKFIVLNPLRQGNTFDVPFVPTLPRKIPSSATLPNNIDLSRLVTLFEGHVSEGRAFLYARDYAIAMARLLKKDVVEQDDVDTFLEMFGPYLESFSSLQQRMDLESSITVSSGHMELLTQIGKYLNGVSKDTLSESLRVTTRHIERSAEFLLEKELIREEENHYYLSPELLQFFNWYKDSFSV
jgi:hypothetical protein